MFCAFFFILKIRFFPQIFLHVYLIKSRNTGLLLVMTFVYKVKWSEYVFHCYICLYMKPTNQSNNVFLLRVGAYPVNSEICSKRSGDSSSPSSCLFYTCSCRGCSASRLLWRCGTRPAPRDRWPRWSCSPCPPRTASSSGTWCCRCTPLDIVHWPLRSPGGRAGRAGCCHPSRWAVSLGFTRGKSDRCAFTL